MKLLQRKSCFGTVFLFSLSALTVACGDSDAGNDDDSDTNNKPIKEAYLLSDENAAAVTDSLVEANTQFAVDLLKALVADAPAENVFFSPISISTALSMTMNGAANETLVGMQSALSLDKLTMEETNEQFLHLLKSLETVDDDLVLTLANSIWTKPGYPIKESFIDTVRNHYLSDVYDITTPEAINSWIEDKTAGHIKEMLKEFPPDLVMYLVNAIYFKGTWTVAFDKDDTYQTSFVKSDKTNVDIDMMSFNEQKEYEAYSDESITAIRLPYGREKISFYAFAPSEWSEANIDDYIDNLDGKKLAETLNSFSEIELGGIHLPKFKIEYEKELNDILKAFGMEKAFEGGFDNMTDPADGNPHISMVKHKSYIEVSEEGTEAAAATVVEVVDESAPSRFLANKPFLFLIRDDRNGTILFVGKLEDPKN